MSRDKRIKPQTELRSDKFDKFSRFDTEDKSLPFTKADFLRALEKASRPTLSQPERETSKTSE